MDLKRFSSILLILFLTAFKLKAQEANISKDSALLDFGIGNGALTNIPFSVKVSNNDGVKISSYQWSIDNGGNWTDGTLNTSYPAFFTKDGLYKIICKVNFTNGKSITSNIIPYKVYTNVALKAVPDNNITELCNNSKLKFTAQLYDLNSKTFLPYTLPETGSNYNWNTKGDATPDLSNYYTSSTTLFYNANAGSSEVTVTYYNDRIKGIVLSNFPSTNIKIKPLPEITNNISLASPCTGTSTFNIEISDTSSNDYSLNWNFGDNSEKESNDPNSVSHSYAQPGKYTVQLNLRNNTTGCTSLPITQSFFIGKPNLTLKTNKDISNGICFSDSSITIELNDSGYGSQYQWVVDGQALGVADSSQSKKYNFSSLGNHNIYVYNIDGCKAESNDLQFVVLKSPASPIFSYTNSGQCNTILFTNNSDSVTQNNYTWTYANKTIYQGSKSQFEYTFDGTGSYNITLTATSKNSTCQNSISKEIQVTGPVLNINGPKGHEGCINWPVQLELSISNLPKNAKPKYYIVDWGDNEKLQLDYSDSTIAKHIYSSIGHYTASISVFFEGSCSVNMQTYYFDITNACTENSKAFGLSVEARDCSNKKRIIINYTDQSDPVDKIYYTAQDDDNTQYKIESTDTTNQYAILFPKTGIYTIHVVKRSGNIGSVWVYIIDLQPKINPNNTFFDDLCAYKTATLLVDKSTGDELSSSIIKSFSWKIDDQKITQNIDLTHFAYQYKPNSSSYDILYQLEDLNNCVSTAQYSVSPQGPNIDFELAQPNNDAVNIIKSKDSIYFQSCKTSFAGKVNGLNNNPENEITSWQWNIIDNSKQAQSSDLSQKSIELNFLNETTYAAVSLNLVATGTNAYNGKRCVSAPVQKIVAILTQPSAKYSIENNERSFCVQKGKVFTFDPQESTSYSASQGIWDWQDGKMDTANYNEKISHSFPILANNEFVKTYNPKLTIMDYYGCKSSYQPKKNSDSLLDNSLIRITQPESIFSYTSDKQNCLPKIVDFDNQSKYASSFEWNFGDGSVRPATQEEIVQHQYYTLDTNANNTPTIYNISLIAKDQDGCQTKSVAQKVSVNGIYAKIKINKTDSICEGQDQLILSVDKYYSAPVSNWGYTWTLGNGDLDIPKDSTIRYTYPKTGVFTPIAAVTGFINNETCEVSAFIQDTSLVVYHVPNPKLTSTMSPQICVGNSFNLNFDKNETSTDPLGKRYIYTYKWTPAENVNYTANIYSLFPKQNTEFQFVASNGICKMDTSFTIKVDQLPTASIDSLLSFCRPTTDGYDTIHVALSNADRILDWKINEASSDWVSEIVKNKTYVLKIPSDYNVYKTPFTMVIDKSDGVCGSIDINSSFHISANPVVQNISFLLNNKNYINSTTSITAGQKATIIPNIILASPYEKLNYVWGPKEIFDNYTSENPSFISNENQTISYLISNEYNCRTEGDFSIIVTDIPQTNIYQRNIPNAFTPNGDGKNDYFYICGFGIKLVKSLAIFDRNGRQIFLSTNALPNDQLQGWNGTFSNGSKAPTATYVYMSEIITNEGKSLLLKGVITLIQ